MSLQLHNLRFSYGSGFELHVPELVIQPGESIALVGPSGSGKTTLLNLVAGILRPDQGTILLGDQCLTDLSSRSWRQLRLGSIGMIFQSFELLEYLDLRDNVLLQARLAPGIAVTDKLVQRARAISSELGLGDKWRRPITALSQGERQRVAACRALLLDPPLVLADEPTGNLDSEMAGSVMDLLRAINEEGTTIVMVTHDPDLARQASRNIHILDGRASDITLANTPNVTPLEAARV